MSIKFVAMPTEEARRLRNGGSDANGHLPERRISDDDGAPCRHCLRDVPAGAAMLVLSYRPFAAAQPYAEQGPVFLCADHCERHEETPETPAMFLKRQRFLLRGYGKDDRIVYGSGSVVASQNLADEAASLLQRDDIAYLHLRSGSYNCYQCRIERAGV